MSIDKIIKSKQYAKRHGNLRQLAEITKTLGDMYFENDQPEEALREYTEQLNVCDNLNDRLSCAVAHRMIGEVYANLGDYEQALMHQNLHLDGARDMKNLIEEQRAFATLGRTHFRLAESLLSQSREHNEALANAKAAYVKSMELCDKLAESEIKPEEEALMRARLYLNLGLTLEAQREESQQAIDLMEQAIALCLSNDFQEDLHRTYISLAAVYERQGNYELALSYLENAAAVNDVCLKAEARLLKAELLMRTGQWIETRKILVSLYTKSGLPKDISRQVEKYLRIIVTLCRTENSLLVETDVRTKQKLYETLGDAAIIVQCFSKGAEYYQHMLTCAEETGEQVDIALVSLAQTLKDAGRCEEALLFARRELELCVNPREKCRSALFLVDLLISTNAADTEIRQHYALAWNSANENNNVKLRRSVAKELVRFLENSGRLDEANDIRRKAELVTEVLSDTESEVSSEKSDEIGADICLEDLSDVEAEESIKRASTRRRGKWPTAIKRNEKGETQLHVACINGEVDTVERLLSNGHSTNVRDHYGWSPLHEAANHGHVEIAELLLKHGANINDAGGMSCKGVTPLHDAAYCGHFSMMELLIQYKADITLKTQDGDTVLDCLEDWRNRVEDLSPQNLVEYEMMHKKLSAVISTRKKRKKLESVRDECSDEEQSEEEVQKISAGEDYKRTIANLRSFNKINSIPTFKSKNEAVAPLVNEEEVLFNDWLEEDISITTKRKSTSSNFVAINKRKSEGSAESVTKRFKRKNTFHEEFSTDENSDENTAEMFQSLEELNKPAKKQQISLFSSGFTVSRSPSPVTLQLSPHLTSPHTYPRTSTSTKQYSKEYVNIHALVKGKTYDVKVEICEDEKEFIMCIVATLEHTFLSETGCTAKLLLQPINENVITKESILKVTRENANNRLECEIVELQVPSIVERYKIICHTRNTTPCEIILKCLKSCENTSVFRVKPNDVNEELLMPLLKTLEYQTDIKLLQLSGTVLLTAGTQLCQCLSNLSSLQELYLKGCDIDCACLREINSLPPQLRVLDLSYNPLSSESCETLRKLLAPLKHLQALNLRYCKLEDLYPPLDIPNLTSCDISWNKLNCHTTTSFLSRQLFDLNLSNGLISSNQFALSLDTNAILSGLESLELSFCGLTDTDVKIIVVRLPRLLKLILSGNANVSVSSVNILLSRCPTLAYIDVGGCKNIASIPETGLVIQNPEICTLLASVEPNLCDSWIELWRGTGTVTKLPHNLAIFKPI